MNLSSLSHQLTKNHFVYKIKISPVKFLILIAAISISVFLSSCASSKKFSSEAEVEYKKAEIAGLRILLGENFSSLSFAPENALELYNEDKLIALIKQGNNVAINQSGGSISVSIGGKSFTSSSFIFLPSEAKTVSFNGKKYRGSILLTSAGKILNVLPLEEYLKGVLSAEMPAGKGTENYEALKAMAICARTYTIMKLNEKKPDFDLFFDVRDQAYGGASGEKEITNKAVDETAGMILEYNTSPAVIFYHASCGGVTEDGGNVFSGGGKPYLTSVTDYDHNGVPYCTITPRFEWEEIYTMDEFASRFIKAGLITEGMNTVSSVEVKSRFPSGRVNNLVINFASASGENKEVTISGNQIRSIIRTADNKGILRSTMFEAQLNESTITIKGKGYGHGVGLCQWGAIAQSRLGISYKDILTRYFPGTEINKMD